ncbi:MAG TPA: 50S ribosomal protein L25 [Acidimicrobiia bacterium]|nr:50S ribosomal protein L25 [Acidimicrobiia bacterium]
MPDIVLAATPRSERGSRPAGRLRRAGGVPAVVYGLGNDPITVSVPSRELAHILAGEAGANTLINLQVDGDTMLTLARQIQRHPTRGDLVHVDFIRIRRDVAVSADVPLHLLGEPNGVRDGGLLEQLVFTVTVEAMPGNIPVALELEVSELGIGDQRHASDVALPDGVTTHLDPETVVAQVAAPRVIAEEVPEGEVAEGEEGEAPAEGAAPEGPSAEASGDRGE